MINYRDELDQRLTHALETRDSVPLETYLIENDKQVRELLDIFVELVAGVIQQPEGQVNKLATLLDVWCENETTAPRDVLACAAVRSYGRAAVLRSEWWADEIRKLREAVFHDNRRICDCIETALQEMVQADPRRTLLVLEDWSKDPGEVLRNFANHVLASQK